MAVGDPAARSPAQRRQAVHVLWAAMMASLVVYLVAAFVVVQVVGLPPLVPREHHGAVGLAVVAVAVIDGAASVLLRRRALAVAALNAGGDPFARFQVAHVIAWALGEVVGLVGFVATMVTADVRLVVLGCAMGLVLIGILHRPDFTLLEAAARRHRR